MKKRSIGLLLFTLLTAIALNAQSNAIPPIAWEIQRYNGYPPRQLWLSIDGQPGQVIYAEGFHDAFFSPDRQTIAFVAQDLLGNNYLQGDLILEAITPFGFGDRGLSADIFGDVPEELHYDDISFIGVQWIDNERLLFNSMYTTVGNFSRPNRMDLHMLDIYQRHEVIYDVGAGGWAFPDPTGEVIALFSANTLRILSATTYEELNKFTDFDPIYGSDTMIGGTGYPFVEWSADGSRLLFHATINEQLKTCLMQFPSQSLTCTLELPFIRNNIYSPDLNQVAYIARNELVIGTLDDRFEIVDRLALDDSEPTFAVAWISNETLLYRTIDTVCTESYNHAPSHYYAYTIGAGEALPWLADYTVIETQQLSDTLFTIASGDCNTITVQLYDSHTDEMTVLGESSHSNSMYWFRFVP